ncbi:MAG: ATP-binding protein [Desulfobacteraceae bacterium]
MSVFRSLAFRLTLLYAGIFILSSCIAFVFFYVLVSQTILNRIDQDLKDKAGRFSAVLSVKGIAGVKHLAVMEARAAGEKKVFFRLLYPSGEVFASSHMAYWQKIEVAKGAVDQLVKGQKNIFETVSILPDHQKVRVLYHRAGPGLLLQTGLSMDSYDHFKAAFKKVFVFTMTIVVFLSAVSGWFMSVKALSGVAEITETAERISGQTLSARVPESGTGDDLDFLAKTFNKMLDRIEKLVKSIVEMSDNIAHDLKSPITRIRGLAEVTLTEKGGREDFKAMAASTIEEADTLLDMINTMLVISRTDAGEGEFFIEQTDLTALVSSACELFLPVAQDRKIDFQYTIEKNCTIMADRRMIQRAVSNLIDNALKYTPAGGNVTVELAVKHRRQVHITIKDTGQGIDPQYLEKIFERFYRIDPVRGSSGTGLGLSLARAVIREHGGDIMVDSTPGQGSRFIIVLFSDRDDTCQLTRAPKGIHRG